MTTSLQELCSTDGHRAIATALAGCGILTDGDFLLADETVLKRTALSQLVCPSHKQAKLMSRNSMSFPGMSYTRPSIPFEQINS